MCLHFEGGKRRGKCRKHKASSMSIIIRDWSEGIALKAANAIDLFNFSICIFFLNSYSTMHAATLWQPHVADRHTHRQLSDICRAEQSRAGQGRVGQGVGVGERGSTGTATP